MTVRPRPTYDPQPCTELRLSGHLDERAAAWLHFPPHPRCVHLSAVDDVSWDTRGVWTLALRVAARPPVILDDLPIELADALAVDILRVLDFLSTAA